MNESTPRSNAATVGTTAVRCVLVAAFAVWAAGCGDATGVDGGPLPEFDQVSTADQEIKNGQVAPDADYVIGMARQGSQGVGLCTGTLVAPNLILTARHCVSELPSRGGIRCGRTRFQGKYPARNIGVTTETRLRQARGSFRRVDKIHVPNNSREVCGNDIALVTLNQNIPSSEAKTKRPRLSKPPARGDDYTAYGYGRTGGSGGKSGVRRKRESRRVLCAGQNCGIGSVVKKEFVGNGGTCRGDSGGGPFDSKGRVFGALSRGGGNCRRAVYSSTFRWRRWIRKIGQKAAGAGGYKPLKWAEPTNDADDDGFADRLDTCPNTPNPKQRDTDGDGEGDACDDDLDGDGVKNDRDNCEAEKNPNQKDTDGDGKGDACDEDLDGDGVENDKDNCPETPNPDQTISDADGTGDACDDSDGDGVVDADDNCPTFENPDQKDSDNDGTGDVCEESNLDDSDGDGVYDRRDNCPETANGSQYDRDDDGEGDACDDSDEDGVVDADDTCPEEPNPDQTDTDDDGVGDACSDDDDGDGVADADDNCPKTANPDQTDTDDDGQGDACSTDDESDDPADGGDDEGTVIYYPDRDEESNGCSSAGSIGSEAPVGGVIAVLVFAVSRRRRNG